MIRAQVLTIMEFAGEDDFRRYLTCDQEAIITGFSKELEIAFLSGRPFVFPTPRPEYGTVVTSHITVEEVNPEKEKGN